MMVHSTLLFFKLGIGFCGLMSMFLSLYFRRKIMCRLALGRGLRSLSPPYCGLPNKHLDDGVEYPPQTIFPVLKNDNRLNFTGLGKRQLQFKTFSIINQKFILYKYSPSYILGSRPSSRQMNAKEFWGAKGEQKGGDVARSANMAFLACFCSSCSCPFSIRTLECAVNLTQRRLELCLKVCRD